MKKIKHLQAYFVATFFILCSIILFFPAVQSQAYEYNDDIVVIDGVSYEYRSGYAYLYDLPAGQGQSDITVHNKIVYKGKEYKINFFAWANDEISSPFYVPKKLKGSQKYANSYYQLLKKITIEKGIRTIDTAHNYQNLEEVIFEDSEYISDANFNNCPKLKNLYIPKNVQKFPLIFRCNSLKVTIAADNPYLKVVNGDVYSKNGRTLYKVFSKKKNYKVKSSVKRISTYAFSGNDFIKSIKMGNNVKKVSDFCFADMANLKSLKLSKSLKSVPLLAIALTPKLKTITFPSNIKSITKTYGYMWMAGPDTSPYKAKKIYIQTRNLKNSALKYFSKKSTIYVKNSSVRKQVQKYGFNGKIIIKK